MAHDNTKKQNSSLFGDKPYSTVAALVLAVFGTAAALDHVTSDKISNKTSESSNTLVVKEDKAPSAQLAAQKPASLNL